jgi:hypothetical protein
MTENHYVLLGGPEHLDFFEHNSDYVLEQWFWTVPSTAKVEEKAFIYLTAPVSRIVGKVVIISEPFYNIGQFDNPHTKNKWMAEVKVVRYFKSQPGLTIGGLRSLFPDWRWLAWPQGKTRIPDEIVEPFLELTDKAEGVDPDET